MGESNCCTDCMLMNFCCNDKYDNNTFHQTLKDFNIEWASLCNDEQSISCRSEWYYNKVKAYINEMNRYTLRNRFIGNFEEELK